MRRRSDEHARSLRSARTRRRYIVRGLGALALLGIAWLAVTAVLAAEPGPSAQRSAGTRSQPRRSWRYRRRTQGIGYRPVAGRDAHELTTGPAWWIAAHIPYLGRPVEEVRGTATAGMQIGVKAVPLLIDVATEVDPAKLRASGDSVRLAPLIRAAPKLAVGAGVSTRRASTRRAFRTTVGSRRSTGAELRSLPSSGRSVATSMPRRDWPRYCPGCSAVRVRAVISSCCRIRRSHEAPVACRARSPSPSEITAS